MYAIRWSDIDRYFGPFTYARDGRHYRPFAVELGSGNDEDDDPACRLRLSAFGHTLIIALPPLIRPWRNWVDTSMYSGSKGPGSGYWEVHRQEFGFSWVERAFHVHYGPQTHDSTTTKSRCFFVPWQNWRFVRHSLYGLAGEHHWTESDRRDWAAYHAAKDACPKAAFAFLDYDGERIVATTMIEEREWLFGEGAFKWLSWFRKPKIRRSLAIDYSAEVGDRKGSWKGGTMGTGIDMLPGELHDAAFRRHCEKDGLKFIAPEPVYVAQTAEAKTPDDIHAWWQLRGKEAWARGATFFRYTVDDAENPQMILIEGWAEQPDDQGPFRWAVQPKESDDVAAN